MTKNMKNEDKILIGGGVIAVGVLGYLYWKKKQQQTTNTQPANEPAPATVTRIEYVPVPVAGNNTSNTTIVMNQDKVLGVGSKGEEVKELQKLLGVPADGSFGAQTEKALLARKGVKAISLKGYKAPAPAAPIVLPKKGAKLMSIKNDIHIFNAIKTANGSYFNSGASDYFGSKFDYGQHVGTYVSVNYAGKYLILRDGKYYFVDGKSVKTY